MAVVERDVSTILVGHEFWQKGTSLSYRQPRPCPLCAGPSDPCFVAGNFYFYRCRQCGTAYVDPLPSDAFLAEYYSTYHLDDAAGGVYDQIESRMQSDFPAKLDLVRRYTSSTNGSSTRILDVGCGKVFFVKAAVDGGLDAEGCDLSSSGVSYAVDVLGVKAHLGPLEALKARGDQFDAVTFWATIEHLPNPMDMLRDIYDVLKPGGMLFLDTGIGDDWLDRLVPGRVQWYDPPQHLFVFSAKGLSTAVESAGFKMLNHDCCFERTAWRRFLRRLRNGTTASILRAAAELGRLESSGFRFTRFPLGNLQSIVARRDYSTK